MTFEQWLRQVIVDISEDIVLEKHKLHVLFQWILDKMYSQH